MVEWVDVRQLVSRSDYLLHHLDVSRDGLTFLPTSIDVIRKSSFIDGRTQLAVGPPLTSSLREGLIAAAELPRARRRFLFHLAFCGSTHLSRLLDVPGQTLILREPNSLVELATWKAGGQERGHNHQKVEALAALACASLFCAGSKVSERIVVKPSNWANNLLVELTDDDTKALFLTMPVRPFLRAVFRGGRERLAFAARAAAHLAAENPRDEAMLSAAASSAPDPLGKIAAFAALLHHMQLARFRDVMILRGWNSDNVIDYGDFARWPLAAAHFANGVMDLGLTPKDLSRSVHFNGRFHSKEPAMAFQLKSLVNAEEVVEGRYGVPIDRALAWACEYLPAIELPAPAEAPCASSAA